jgi:sortase (surface protein transpeptidase)
VSGSAGVRLASAQPSEPPGHAPWPEPAPASLPPEAGQEPTSPPSENEGGDEPAEEAAPAVEAAPAPISAPPVKLMIPSLGVEAAVEPVGDDPEGYMATPTHPDDVAWYEPGVPMGVPGNVVFAAHVNWDGRLRPFGLLHLLGPGDVVQVIDAQDRGYEYVVESSHWVRAEGAPVAEIFAQPREPVITLITCGGEYVATTREYLDRLIVRARGA